MDRRSTTKRSRSPAAVVPPGCTPARAGVRVPVDVERKPSDARRSERSRKRGKPFLEEVAARHGARRWVRGRSRSARPGTATALSVPRVRGEHSAGGCSLPSLQDAVAMGIEPTKENVEGLAGAATELVKSLGFGGPVCICWTIVVCVIASTCSDPVFDKLWPELRFIWSIRSGGGAPVVRI